LGVRFRLVGWVRRAGIPLILVRFRLITFVRFLVLVGVVLSIGLVVVFSVFGLTLVSDISDKAGIAIDVVINFLTAAIGLVDVVVSFGVVSFAVLLGAEIDVIIIIFDIIIVMVVHRGLSKI
jgi:hypothetical protein